MPTYSSLTDRSDVAGTIPVEYSNQLLDGISKEASHLMRHGRQLRNMKAKEQNLPVLSALASAYFVNGDTGLVETSEVNWKNVTITAEALAVIIPVPKDVLSDSSIPLWDSIMPDMVEAGGLAVDNAQLYGTNKPASWPDALVTAAIAAANDVELGSGADLYEELLTETGVFAKVEADGFPVTGAIADLTMKGRFRGVRTSDGLPIFSSDATSPFNYSLDGVPIGFPMNGAGNSSYPLICGDWRQLAYSIREDVSFDVFTEGVITDGSGAIQYNLMQQRMAAVMLTFRLGFAVPNTINRTNTDNATRYPFAVLKDLA